MGENMLRKIVIVIGFFGISLPAAAYVYPTAQELQVMPPYCKKTAVISKHLGNEQAPTGHDAETQGYVEKYGQNFWSFHHYCFGHMHLNRAYLARGRDEKEGQLRTAIKEFDYVLRAVEPDYFMLPEIYSNKGRVLLLLKEEPAAVVEFRKAIALNPAYVQPYYLLSDYYEDKNKKEMAIKILEEGLTNKPDAKSLLNRYKRLGGKREFKIAAPPEEKTSPPNEKEVIEMKETPVKPDEKAEPLQNKAPEPSKPEVGKPNPYCRFCP